MSREDSSSITPVPTATSELNHQIQLVDKTRPSAELRQTVSDYDDDSPATTPDLERSATGLSLRKTATSLSKRVTTHSHPFHDARTKRRYARWQEGNLIQADDGPSYSSQREGDMRPSITIETSVSEEPSSTGGDAPESSNAQQQSASDAANLLSPKRAVLSPSHRGLGKPLSKLLSYRPRYIAPRQRQEDTVIDILFENQRGWFFFHVPLFSSASLLPLDPTAWTTIAQTRDVDFSGTFVRQELRRARTNVMERVTSPRGGSEDQMLPEETQEATSDTNQADTTSPQDATNTKPNDKKTKKEKTGNWLQEGTTTFAPSPVNIMNAIVPDPSWRWAWPRWHVDMARDVDEDGWEYSLGFNPRYAWHGSHPWFHSFVRRRKWLRKRVRIHGEDPTQPDGSAGDDNRLSRTSTARDGNSSFRGPLGEKRLREGHHLRDDYFTIHPSTKHIEDAEMRARFGHAATDLHDIDEVKIENIGTLMSALHHASVDREKIVLVRKFLQNGGSELHYLQENMSHIMSLMVFQTSRQELLTMLMHAYESAKTHRDEHIQSQTSEDDGEKSTIDALLNAAEAADAEVAKLEYWSDIQNIARAGRTLTADDQHEGWNENSWEGLTQGAPELEAEAFASKEAGRDTEQRRKIMARAKDMAGVSFGEVHAATDSEGSKEPSGVSTPTLGGEKSGIAKGKEKV